MKHRLPGRARADEAVSRGENDAFRADGDRRGGRSGACGFVRKTSGEEAENSLHGAQFPATEGAMSSDADNALPERNHQDATGAQLFGAPVLGSRTNADGAQSADACEAKDTPR